MVSYIRLMEKEAMGASGHVSVYMIRLPVVIMLAFILNDTDI